MPIDKAIGLRPTTERCYLCKNCVNMPDFLNRITMDLLLSRKTAQELVDEFNGPSHPLFNGLTLEDLATHAEHCDASMVPDDYICMPEKYERGERARYATEKARQDQSTHKK